jgi:hypothetical protein
MHDELEETGLLQLGPIVHQKSALSRSTYALVV